MNHAPTILALSRQTVEWVRRGGKPTRASRRRLIQLAWQSFWFERHLALSRRLPLAPAPPSDPVIILGLWRSGSTFLHDLLGAYRSLIYPTTWQCMHPSLHRLHPAPTPSTRQQRPMDGLMVDAASPQEDEFALLALGVPSVYRGFLDPRRLPELTQWLNPAAWSSDEPAGWMSAWQAFLAGVIGDRSGRLLLKSPHHTFRFQALVQAVPNATYVWIVRDPAEVWHSNRKMWLAMFRMYALWDWDEAILGEFLQKALQHAGDSLSAAVKHVPADRLAIVDFSRLTQRPVEYMHALNQRLGLANWKDVVEPVTAKATQFTAYRKDAYRDTDFPASIATTLEALRLVQRRALASHGL